MGKYFLLFLGIIAVNHSAGQTASVILFSEDDRKFRVFLNESAQHATAVKGIRINALTDEFYNLVLQFESPDKFEKNFSLAVQQSKLTTYSIRTNNDGNIVLRFVSEEPLVFETSLPKYTPVNFNPGKKVVPHVSDKVAQSNVLSNDPEIAIEQINEAELCESETSTVLNPEIILPANYSGTIGCSPAISSEKFNDIISSVRQIEDENKRLASVTKEIMSSCFYSEQVKALCEILDYEGSRLEVAKTAYAHVFDIDNFKVVEEVFTFSTSVDELYSFIRR